MKWDPANDVPGGYQGGQSAMNTLFAEPRSLLIFSHDAFWHHRHGIDAAAAEDIPSNLVNLEQAAAWGYKPGDRLERDRRVSFTMRWLGLICLEFRVHTFGFTVGLYKLLRNHDLTKAR
ncbi:alkbh6 [Symbiodinium pilosum]|uniref:Alkbh6 protein n=1 Tax=Symbiodinium pilosum TaxID=2952 RepID=A0A812WEA2_SYMPI|nr:alkbh6 [Symbiodinium pilosum]